MLAESDHPIIDQSQQKQTRLDDPNCEQRAEMANHGERDDRKKKQQKF